MNHFSMALCLLTSTISATTLLADTTSISCNQQIEACKHQVELALDQCTSQHGHYGASQQTLCQPTYELETDSCYNQLADCQQHQLKQAMLAMAYSKPASTSTTLAASSRKALGSTKTIDSSAPGNS